MKLKTKTDAQTKTSVTEYEVAYAAILSEEKALAMRKSAIQDLIRPMFDKTGTDTIGKFSLTIRKSLAWRKSDIAEIFGDEFIAYMIPDAKLLKVKMESVPELAACAIVTESTALTFKN